MEDEGSPTPTPLLLGRPFMKMARTKIDVYNGTLIMEFDGEIVRFNIFKAMRYPSDLNACFSIDTLDTLAQQMLDLDCKDTLKVVMRNSLEHDKLIEMHPSEELLETMGTLETTPITPMGYTSSFISLSNDNEKLLPSILHTPKLELKTLPDHLKYVFLRENKTLPVIIASNISSLQEGKDRKSVV